MRLWPCSNRHPLASSMRTRSQTSVARSGAAISGLKPASTCASRSSWHSASVPLSEEAHEELIASGARPRRLVRSGADALTPSERRIAALAAEGLSNREIAQSLFVTLRTVEMHLSNAFRKLDISSRTQLPAALAAEPAALVATDA